jgi:predicted nucleic acid-binding protein
LHDATGLHLPHLCVVEVTNALRTLGRRGDLTEERGRAALEDLADLPAQRHPAEPLLPRVWQLRGSVTAYDAMYLALAEALEATPFTADRRLADSAGHHATIDPWPVA